MSKLFRIPFLPFLAPLRRSKTPPADLEGELAGVRKPGGRPQGPPPERLDASKEETVYIGTFTPEL